MPIHRLAIFLLAAALLAAQNESATLTIIGAVKQPLTLTVADLTAMPRASGKTTYHGVTTTYEGVWLQDVLKRAGVPQGEELHGKALSAYLLAQASDGYQVVFSLGELDAGTGGAQALLADKADGKPLPAKEGTFRLVLLSDKRPDRSIFLLKTLEVVQLRK